MYPCEKVGLDFVETAPHRFVNSVDLPCTPERVFAVLSDADAWPRWAKAITKVTWTSPEPYGVGTTRTVAMRGGLVGAEEFLAWEPSTRMAFRFGEASQKTIAAFAEDYTVVETPGGCRLTWTMAIEVRGVARLTMAPARPLLNLALRRWLTNLRALVGGGS
jgi:hypothetical protein